MTSSLSPLSPSHNAVMMASAGTGKTWQLVTRLLRLLLEGASPDSILAITFTRKAAAEMEARLLERLFTLAHSSDERLHQELRIADAPITAETLHRARRLHEDLLRASRPLRTTTFHAFCQEILRRFPLEADVPPGFELIETHGELAEAAWQALLNEVATAPDALLAQKLEQFLELCGGITNLRSSLFGFLEQRGDWWAFIENEAEGVPFAIERLGVQLGIEPNADPLHNLFDHALETHLAEFVVLMSRHPGVENERQLSQLALSRDTVLPIKQRFETLQSALLTKEGNPRKRKPSKAQAKSMGGEANESRFLELAELLCARTLTARQQLAARDNWHFNTLWYQIGNRLLEHFQRIKNEQRLLDFTDLEWKSYRLLTHGENAHWIQYKLDQRINHLLVDEFQDTNPTQWRMLLPLLSEMAAGQSDRARTVFLVGDSKQSIYRFRRAEPRLFPAAQEWLETYMQAATYPLHSSRRSAPAIITCVNQLFSLPQMRGILDEFTPHATHLNELWGKVVVLPHSIPTPQIEQEPHVEGLRNPLLQPRSEAEDSGILLEARQVASAMRLLIDAATPIGSDTSARPIHYGDIMLLLRTRTRVHYFERALREAGIPFIGADRGTLLESIEVRDMIALIQTLLTPFDNLALATVLRSPIGSCSNDDLIALSGCARDNWWQRLMHSSPSSPSLQRMATLLMRWHSIATQLPIHDLLDRIYCEGNILERYEAAYPEHLRSRVRANLVRFLELALEIDSGRYPSLNHFLARLEQLRSSQQDAPDEAPSTEGHRVRIMTIHASKGLESPVVFLADTTHSEARDRSTFHPLVRWPIEQPNPDVFLLAGRKTERDAVTSQLIKEEYEELQRESVNLLYVAVTRAKQFVYVSGTPTSRSTSSDNWYDLIREAIDPLAEIPHDQSAILELGKPPQIAPVPCAEPPTIQDTPVPPEKFPSLAKSYLEIAPSRSSDHSLSLAQQNDEDGRLRGIAIHRLLQLLTCPQALQSQTPLQIVATELSLSSIDSQLHEWYAEAKRVVKCDDFAVLFEKRQTVQSFCELPLIYRNSQGHTVHGVIDRLVVMPTEILLVDYKTHRGANRESIPAIAQDYYEQLRLYSEGIQRLWPGKRVRPMLLFTAPLQLHEATL